MRHDVFNTEEVDDPWRWHISLKKDPGKKSMDLGKGWVQKVEEEF